MTQQPPATTIAASTLLAHGVQHLPQAGGQARLLKYTLDDGMDVLVWQGQLGQPLHMPIHDDVQRISFACTLCGSAQSCFQGAAPHVLPQNAASIAFHAQQRGIYTQAAGCFESVTVMLRPDRLAAWVDAAQDWDALHRGMAAGHYRAHASARAQLRATAHTLSRALGTAGVAAGSAHAPLWLLGQSLVLVSLVLEAHAPGRDAAYALSCSDQQRLLRARDRLLADVACAPALPVLAREAGLGLGKLQRGFRQMFRQSVYGVLQHERMQQARQHLERGAPVMCAAADVGYTNASHFSAAFKKQFGVNPGQIKLRR